MPGICFYSLSVAKVSAGYRCALRSDKPAINISSISHTIMNHDGPSMADADRWCGRALDNSPQVVAALEVTRVAVGAPACIGIGGGASSVCIGMGTGHHT